MITNSNYSPTVSDEVSEIDRRWFERHPDRQTRLRPARDGELPGLICPPDGWAFVAVSQMMPGARLRLPFVAKEFPPDGEEKAREVVEMILREGEKK